MLDLATGDYSYLDYLRCHAAASYLCFEALKAECAVLCCSVFVTHSRRQHSTTVALSCGWLCFYCDLSRWNRYKTNVYSMRHHWKISHFWPDWNYCIRQSVSYTVFSKTEAMILFWSRTLTLKFVTAKLVSAMAYCWGFDSAFLWPKKGLWPFLVWIISSLTKNQNIAKCRAYHQKRSNGWTGVIPASNITIQ